MRHGDGQVISFVGGKLVAIVAHQGFYQRVWGLNAGEFSRWRYAYDTIDDVYGGPVTKAMITPTPEPGSIALAGLGLGLVGLVSRRLRKRFH